MAELPASMSKELLRDSLPPVSNFLAKLYWLLKNWPAPAGMMYSRMDETNPSPEKEAMKRKQTLNIWVKCLLKLDDSDRLVLSV